MLYTTDIRNSISRTREKGPREFLMSDLFVLIWYRSNTFFAESLFHRTAIICISGSFPSSKTSGRTNSTKPYQTKTMIFSVQRLFRVFTAKSWHCYLVRFFGGRTCFITPKLLISFLFNLQFVFCFNRSESPPRKTDEHFAKFDVKTFVESDSKQFNTKFRILIKDGRSAMSNAILNLLMQPFHATKSLRVLTGIMISFLNYTCFHSFVTAL